MSCLQISNARSGNSTEVYGQGSLVVVTAYVSGCRSAPKPPKQGRRRWAEQFTCIQVSESTVLDRRCMAKVLSAMESIGSVNS